MSHCVVPSWNLRRQRQEQVEGEERNRSSHVHTQLQKPSRLVPMSNCEVTELTWENGQLAMHGLCGPGLLPTKQSKPTGDTLESIVHQATCQKPKIPLLQRHQNHANFSSIVATSSGGSRGKWTEISSGQGRSEAFGSIEKSTRTNFDHCGRKFSSSIEDDWLNQSVCESASADQLCRENDTTMMTWPSFESPCSLKTKTTDEDSACCHGGSENQDEEQETKCETGRSNSTRRSRAAAVHNQSERKRRDRINQKMKALQKLVPNASKTDKASMLDEVIDYLKQLQAQIQMMSAARNMSQTVVPAIGQMQQYHHQMSVLARMGMSGVGLGMGMGMLDMSSLAGMARPPPHSLFPLVRPAAPATAAAAAPTFVPPPFVIPSNASVHMHDPYCALLAQSMNMDLYNKMAALYQQQVNQTAQATHNPSQTSHVHGD